MGLYDEPNTNVKLFVGIASETTIQEQTNGSPPEPSRDLHRASEKVEDLPISSYIEDDCSSDTGSSLEDELEEINFTNHSKRTSMRALPDDGAQASNDDGQSASTYLTKQVNGASTSPINLSTENMLGKLTPIEELLEKSPRVIDVDTTAEETSNVSLASLTTDNSDTSSNSSELDQRSILIIFSGLMVSLFLSSLDLTIVATALPAIVADLGSLDQLSWVVTIYLLTSTASSPLYGKFSDIFGRKAMLLFSLVTFLVGSLICAVATSMTMLIGARAVQGIGGGGLMSAVMIVMAEIVPLRQRGKYQGLIGAVYAVSSVIGPLIGGTFTDNATWRWAFYINLPLGAVALAVVFFALHLPHERVGLREGMARIDVVGTVLLVSAIVAFLLALSWGGVSYGWSHPIILSLFAGAIVTLGLFVVNELYFTNHPIIPMELFRCRNYVLCITGSFCLGFIMFGVIYYIPLYFQTVHGLTATRSGLQLLPTMLGIVILGAVSGLLITRFGHYKTYPVVGTLLMAVGVFLLSLWSVDSSETQFIGDQAVVGCGIGLTMQILVLVVQNSVEPRLISIATATTSFFRTIGGVVGVSLFSTVLNAQFRSNLENLSKQHPDYLGGVDPAIYSADNIKGLVDGPAKDSILVAYSDALCMVFLVATPIAALGCVTTIFIKATKLRNHIPNCKAQANTTPIASATTPNDTEIDIPSESSTTNLKDSISNPSSSSPSTPTNATTTSSQQCESPPRESASIAV
eukprot:gene1106-1262_t